MNYPRIFTSLSVLAFTAMLSANTFAGENCNKPEPAPPQVSRSQMDVTVTPPPPSAFPRPTDTHSIDFNFHSVDTTSAPPAPPPPRKVKYVYQRPLFSSNVVYCRPVPPATKCDDGGFMGFVSGIFGGRSSMMSSQPGFPREATATRLNLQKGYRPPVVAVPVD